MGLFTKKEKPGDFNKLHGGTVLEYIKKMDECNRLAFNTKEFDLKIAVYQRLFVFYDELKAFCESKPGGKEYFIQAFETQKDHTIGNYYSTIKHYKENYKLAEHIRNDIVPAILDMASNGTLLQKDVYDKFDLTQNHIKMILDEMEFEKMIIREKSGNSYVVKLG